MQTICNDVLENVRVGTSGWSYDHWEGRFYPEGMPASKRLSYYTERFDTVEINSSFYHLPLESTFEHWKAGTPDGFLFAVKGSRYATHVKKIAGVAEATALLVRRAKKLEEKLGPILWQVPPQLKRDDERLEGFLKVLPGQVTHVVEFRDPSWFCDSVYDLLDKHRVSFCCVSSPQFVTDLLVTGKVGYLRMHGEKGWYSSRYSTADLRSWAERISRSFAGCERSFVYFNNDAFAYAVSNALELRELLRKL